MRTAQREPIKTFAVGFDIAEFSELHHARKIAERYGTEHHEVVVGADDFIADFARLCWLYDEPMGEPPAIPTYYMCQAAKQHVSVMLTGEGADEQFGGYSKYVFDSFAGMLEWLPAGMRHAGLRGAGAAMPFQGRRLRSILEILGLSSETQRFASWFGGFDTSLQRQLLHPDFLKEVGDGGLESRFSAIMTGCNDRQSAFNRFLYCDIHSRLVDDILVKGDRMSMAAGIEARVPFLDHRVAEFAAGLPSRYKVAGLQKKILLKKLAERYLPHETIYRRKVGFTVPLGRWFGGPLAGLISQVLLSERFFERGYFQPEMVRKVVREHLERKVDREQGIWLLLTLELWHRIFVDDDGSAAASERSVPSWHNCRGREGYPMDKPKIVILSPPLRAVSGFSTHANLLLGSGLAQKYELLHFCVGSEGRIESSLQKLTRLAVSPFALLYLGFRQRPDILHINTGLDHKAYWRDMLYLAVAKLLRAKVVSQIHGGPTPDQFFPHSAALTWLLRRVLSASDAVSVLSLAEYRAYAAFAPGIRLAHIPNAIDTSGLLETIQPPDPRRPLRLVYVGRLVRAKGLFETLDALASLRRAGRRLHLEIAGSGADEPALRARSAELGLEDGVVFRGPLFGNQKNELWRAADLLVFPSYSEGPAVFAAGGDGGRYAGNYLRGRRNPGRDAARSAWIIRASARCAVALAAAIAALDDDRALLERMAHAARARVLEQYTMARLAQDFSVPVRGGVAARG